MSTINIIIIILTILNIVFLGVTIFYSSKIHKTKIDNSYAEEKRNEIFNAIKDLEEQRNHIKQLLIEETKELEKFQQEAYKIAKQVIESRDYEIQVKSQLIKDNMVKGLSHYEQIIEKQYQKIDERFQQLKTKAAAEIEKQERLIAALVENYVRQQKKQKDQDFYKIQLSKNEINDILELEKIKKIIHKPEVVGKIIWAAYCLPKMALFETRLLPKKSKVVGIYKITNSENGMIYIGQSKDVASRWRDHIKYGLGATPATVGNKLYQEMSQFGIWSFTFELLEQCQEKELNEKEKYWIQKYQSNIIGMNVKKGGSK